MIYTYTKRVEFEHSQSGESHGLFMRQIKHFVKIWHSGKWQREPSFLKIPFLNKTVSPFWEAKMCCVLCLQQKEIYLQHNNTRQAYYHKK